VSRPQQYTGGEWNLDSAGVGSRVTLVYPDVYELGMCNFGLSVLRHVLVEAGGLDIRRAFSPSPDMDDILQSEGLDWVDLERGDPVRESRVVGFGVPCESLFTNVLHLVGRMGLPLRSRDRTGEGQPLILLGGGGLSNPLPMAPFADIFFLGEAEEAAPELFRALAGPGVRAERLRKASELPGVWVPMLGKNRVELQRVDGLHPEWAPVKQLVPLSQISQDRAVIEVARGCTRGCRFCQASFISRPVRERPPEQVAGLLDASLACTGWEKGGILTLSFSDYSRLDELMEATREVGVRRHAEIGRPSLRPDTLVRMQAGGALKGRMTLAPEAGSELLRKRLNKDISDAEVLEAADAAFRLGATGLKLYFMVGLPGETEEDVRAIAELVLRLAAGARRRRKKPMKSITVALSPFVPKAHTPLQWAAVMSEEELWRRIGIVRELCGRTVSVTWNSPRVAIVEAILGLGDDSGTSDLLEKAVVEGARFDAWAERFRWDIWERLLSENRGILGAALTQRDTGRPLLWDFISPGPSPSFLLGEWDRYWRDLPTADCRQSGCSGCGACARTGASGSGDPGTAAILRQGRVPDVTTAVLRVRYSKTGLARFSSHLDIVRLWGRVIRRSGLPIAWSSGYVNRPRLQFGPPLPLGMESTAEYVDIHLCAEPGDDPGRRIGDSLPEGFGVEGVRLLPPGCPAPTKGIVAFGYRAMPGTGGWLRGSAEAAAAELTGVEHVLLAVPREDGSVRLVTAAGGRESRPDILLAEASAGAVLVCRTESYRMGDQGLESLENP
jgi:radical SAM superfamily enzyme YgiQ (UPF0313 family)